MDVVQFLYIQIYNSRVVSATDGYASKPKVHFVLNVIFQYIYRCGWVIINANG